jgi:hypothetical protein
MRPSRDFRVRRGHRADSESEPRDSGRRDSRRRPILVAATMQDRPDLDQPALRTVSGHDPDASRSGAAGRPLPPAFNLKLKRSSGRPLPPVPIFPARDAVALAAHGDGAAQLSSRNPEEKRVGVGVVLQEEDHVHDYLRGDPCRSAWGLPLALDRAWSSHLRERRTLLRLM